MNALQVALQGLLLSATLHADQVVGLYGRSRSDGAALKEKAPAVSGQGFVVISKRGGFKADHRGGDGRTQAVLIGSPDPTASETGIGA